MTTEFLSAMWLTPALIEKAKKVSYVFPYIKKVKIKKHYKQTIMPKAVKLMWDNPN